MDATIQAGLTSLMGTYVTTITENIGWVLVAAGSLLAVRFGISYVWGAFKKFSH